MFIKYINAEKKNLNRGVEHRIFFGCGYISGEVPRHMVDNPLTIWLKSHMGNKHKPKVIKSFIIFAWYSLLVITVVSPCSCTSGPEVLHQRPEVSGPIRMHEFQIYGN